MHINRKYWSKSITFPYGTHSSLVTHFMCTYRGSSQFSTGHIVHYNRNHGTLVNINRPNPYWLSIGYIVHFLRSRCPNPFWKWNACMNMRSISNVQIRSLKNNNRILKSMGLVHCILKYCSCISVSFAMLTIFRHCVCQSYWRRMPLIFIKCKNTCKGPSSILKKASVCNRSQSLIQTLHINMTYLR